MGDNAGKNAYFHGDSSGPLDKVGRVAYRFNAVFQDGDTTIDKQSIRRDLLSPVLDINLRSNLLLQLNFKHADYHIYGITPTFNLANSLSAFPAPPDPRKVFTAHWLEFMDRTDTGAKRLRGVSTIASPSVQPILIPMRNDRLQIKRECAPYEITDSQGDLISECSVSGSASLTQTTHTLYGFSISTLRLLVSRTKSQPDILGDLLAKQYGKL